MLDAFKKLFESGMISEEIKSEIETAWNSKLQETRDQLTAELREEFAQRYDHDRSVMIESLDKMIGEKMEGEIAEFVADRQSLAEAKAQYQAKMTQDSDLLESFVMQNLAKELGEFQSDRKKVSENFAKLEAFVVEALAREIKEFAEDKKDLAETKVRLVQEAKSKFAEIKHAFIKKSAAIVESAVNDKLTTEITQLREDIDSARQNHFGRKIFEAFTQEYTSSHVNEKSTTSRLLKIVEKKEQELAEAQKALEEKQTVIESKEREARIARDLMERKEAMQELLAPLSGEKKEVMKQLLESVKTDKLNVAFDKYLPAVMEGKAQTKAPKQALQESKEITGDKPSKPITAEDGIDNLIDIRKLAGLKN
jgi:acyl transferase domain-containing protein